MARSRKRNGKPGFFARRIRRWPPGRKIALFALAVDFFNLLVVILEFLYKLLKR
jgi:hypothetical protein